MNVKILKLITGEDIIARVELMAGVYEIKKGFRLGLTSQGLMMAPLCPFSKDDKLAINEDKI